MFCRMLTFVLRCRHAPYPQFTAVLTPEQETASDGVIVALQAKRGVRAALHASTRYDRTGDALAPTERLLWTH